MLLDNLITYILHRPTELPPGAGKVLLMPFAQPHIGAVYSSFVSAIPRISTPFFCILDGEPDELLPRFTEGMLDCVICLEHTGADLAYVPELINGRVALQDYPHHSVLCRTSAALAIPFPVGCYHFERILYCSLAGPAYESAVRSNHSPIYNWIPDETSLHRDYNFLRADMNSRNWVVGLPQVHLPEDKEHYHGTNRVQS